MGKNSLEQVRRQMINKTGDMDIVMVGAGNLATHLARALDEQGFRIRQVYSRTREAASELATKVGADYTTRIEALHKHAHIYICALKDDALLQLIPSLTKCNPDALWLHTAGSIPMGVWQNYADRHGVFYPLQTFSKHREVDFKEIPLFVEANNEDNRTLIDLLAHSLTDKVYHASSEGRKQLHLAAVFACNFTNHLYALADELLSKWGLPFEAILPLIDETARKVHQLKPHEAQTGPAVRHDNEVMEKQRQMLADMPDVQQIYNMLSESIQKANRQ